MVGPILVSGYERMSNTLSVNSASKIRKMALYEVLYLQNPASK